MMLVTLDNARDEHTFLSEFFSSSGPAVPAPSRPPLHSADSSVQSSVHGGWDMMSRNGDGEASIDADDAMSVITASDLASSTTTVERASGRRPRSSATDALWKQILAPCLEYAQNFVATLLESTAAPPSALHLLAMIRLTERAATQCPTAAMEAYLGGVRLTLWPAFQRAMSSQLESVTKLASRAATSAIKLPIVAGVVSRYARFFVAVVALSEDHDEEMVFGGCACRCVGLG